MNVHLLQAARQIRPHYEPTADLAHVARICRLVEGMPLAILLAASWMDVLSPAEIADEIERGLDFLEADLRDLPARHRSMGAVFDVSWKLLLISCVYSVGLNSTSTDSPARRPARIVIVAFSNCWATMAPHDKPRRSRSIRTSF